MRDARGVVRVMDFGIAKALGMASGGATVTGQIIGTPGVHEPGAGPRRPDRLAQRHLRPGHRGLRDLHGQRAVPRRDPDRHPVQAHPGPAAHRRPARDPAPAGAHPEEGAGQGPGRPLRVRERHGGGAARGVRGGSRARGRGDGRLQCPHGHRRPGRDRRGSGGETGARRGHPRLASHPDRPPARPPRGPAAPRRCRRPPRDRVTPRPS